MDEMGSAQGEVEAAEEEPEEAAEEEPHGTPLARLPTARLRQIVTSAGLSHSDCLELSELRSRARQATKLLLSRRDERLERSDAFGRAQPQLTPSQLVCTVNTSRKVQGRYREGTGKDARAPRSPPRAKGQTPPPPLTTTTTIPTAAASHGVPQTPKAEPGAAPPAPRRVTTPLVHVFGTLSLQPVGDAATEAGSACLATWWSASITGINPGPDGGLCGAAFLISSFRVARVMLRLTLEAVSHLWTHTLLSREMLSE